MTDNEIVKVKEISLEKQIEHYNERLKEVFEWYNRRNTNGGEDPLEICVLRDSSRLIPKLVDLINRLQAENDTLRTCVEQIPLIRKDGKSPLSLLTAEIKAEAYKEVLAKVNEIITEIYNKHIFGSNDLTDEEKDAIINFSDDVTYRLDNPLKELVGEQVE